MSSSKSAARPSGDKKRTKEKKNKKSKKEKSTKKVVEKDSFKSSEYVADSDREDDEEAPIPATVSNSDSDEDSLPEDPAVKKAKPNDKATAKTASPSASDNEEESRSGSDSKSDSESEDDDQEEVKVAKVNKKPTSNPTKDSAAKTVSFVAPAPYKPPAGFDIAAVEGNPKASQFFKKSNLEGKQIWYITAPALVPISSIVNMSLRNTNNGTVAFSLDGDDYGFVHDTVEDKTYTKIMVPSSSKDGYFTDSKPIDRILHLQQIVKLPAVYDSSIDIPTSRATVPANKPVRQQPKGLKMRYRPSGFGDGPVGKIGPNSVDGSSTESGADEDMQVASPIFRRPSLSESTGNKDSDVEMNDAPPSSSKSSKKSKTDRGADHSLKRKHKDAEHTRENNSSFRSTKVENKKLKKTKTSQINSPGSTVGKQPVSINPPKTTTPIPLPTKVSKSLPVTQSPIRPPNFKPASFIPSSSSTTSKSKIPLLPPQSRPLNASKEQASTPQGETGKPEPGRTPKEKKDKNMKKHREVIILD